MLNDRTWLLIGRKMANEASAEELEELEHLLKMNPELHFSLQTLSDLWNIQSHDNKIELENIYASHISKIKDSSSELTARENENLQKMHSGTLRIKRSIPVFKTLIAGIGIASVFVMVVYLYPSVRKMVVPETQKKLVSEISTRDGSKSMIRLPDGTSVWLNAGSKLTYEKDFGENIREVNLTGEAFFDVVRNVHKPFIIHTKALDIKVLGTRFNVKSYPNEKTTETSLIKGSIEVTIKDRKADKIIMKPNEKLVIANEAPEETRSAERKRSVVNAPIITLSHLNYFSIDSTIIETSWVENRLVFEDESFAELSLKLSRWYGVNFHFNAPEIEKLRFTGNFKGETIHEALSAMKITAAFNYKINHNNIEISK